MDLDLHDLAVYLAVVREGSFGRAATSLLVSQPAVSERIRHLERVVGRPVFERTSRGAALTPAGEQLLPYAQRCLTLADEALEAVRRAEGAPQFVIAVHSTFAPRIVPLALGALGSLPRRVIVRDAHSHEVQAMVLDGVADVGFAIPGPAPRGLRRIALSADPIVCVAAPDHPLAGQRRVAVGSLKRAVLAINRWGDGADDFVERLTQTGIDDWRMRFCADASTAVTLARDHGHVAFVTHSTAADEIREGRLHRLGLGGLAQWTVQLELIHRVRSEHDDAVRAVVQAVTRR